MPHLNGVCAALCTTISSDANSFDEGAFRAHIDRVIEASVFPSITNINQYSPKKMVAEKLSQASLGSKAGVFQTYLS